MKTYKALAERIRAAFFDLENTVAHTLELSQKAKTSNDDAYWEAVALNLHSFYTGVERVFEDIARVLDDDVPSGANWHIDLLTQMAEEIENARPAIIEQETKNSLDLYRGLRHIVRNVYAFNLRPARLNELTNDLPSCFENVKRDLSLFAQFLESLD
jgi:hypothetical protein